MFYGQNFRTSHFPHTFVALRADQQGEIKENRINLVCKVRPQANSRFNHQTSSTLNVCNSTTLYEDSTMQRVLRCDGECCLYEYGLTL